MNLVMILASMAGALLTQANPPGREILPNFVFSGQRVESLDKLRKIAEAYTRSLAAQRASIANAGGNVVRTFGPKSQTGLCAIPLLNVLPESEHYHIRTVPLPAEGTLDQMPAVQVPAPACEPSAGTR